MFTYVVELLIVHNNIECFDLYHKTQWSTIQNLSKKLRKPTSTPNQQLTIAVARSYPIQNILSDGLVGRQPFIQYLPEKYANPDEVDRSGLMPRERLL